MSDFYVEWRKHQNIKPIKLPNKEQYYTDLMHIEHSWSGRIDANLCNTFIMEAEQQLVNAIELFEMGYFDCAYYSLRSTVELSTTMVFLADLPDAEREKQLEAWKATLDFPMETQMIRQLAKSGAVFADMLTKMADFFSGAKKLNAELNKFVHKQGLQHFYLARNHPINQHKSQTAFIKTFEEYLTRCIGVVAVMRLAIDPFPILLMDEEILFRCFDSMTGVRYEKRINNTRQPKVIIDYISNLGINKNEFLIYVDSKLSALDFSLDSDSFENALKEIGIILGFDSTRPDKETKGEGPDNLWAIGNNQYLVIECKNEATSETVSKTYCNQLAGSIRWFSSEYGDNFTATPILVHKSFILDRQASPVEKMRIITQEKLADFKRKIKDFVNALVQDTNWQDEIRIQQLLNQYNLNSESIVNMYSVDYLKNKS